MKMHNIEMQYFDEEKSSSLVIKRWYNDYKKRENKKYRKSVQSFENIKHLLHSLTSIDIQWLL